MSDIPNGYKVLKHSPSNTLILNILMKNLDSESLTYKTGMDSNGHVKAVFVPENMMEKAQEVLNKSAKEYFKVVYG